MITKKKFVRWFWGLFAIPFVVLALLLLLVRAFADIPSYEELENPPTMLATQVISRDRQVLTTYHIENRVYVPSEGIPDNLVHAAVATEDVRFYDHSGIDIKSLFRVLFKTILMSRSSQGGGSTITQQLAKALYPRPEDERISKPKMVVIKLKEWITAVKLERNFTKEEIMNMYLNEVFFGSHSYGIQAAARHFYSKDPSKLRPEESAVLIGAVNKPTRYNPNLNPEHSLKRRNFVLGQMAKAGYLTERQADSLQRIPIKTHTVAEDKTIGTSAYFRDMLRKYMTAEKPRSGRYQHKEEFQADSLLWADDPLYGWLNKNQKNDGTPYDLDRDGLRIYTTIDSRMQRYAEQAVAEHLGKTLQKTLDAELKWRKHYPFSNGVSEKIIKTTMAQSREWSDRTRMMRLDGKSEREISKSFDEPQKMRLFTWNAPGYRDTTMTPNDSILYYKAFLRAAFMAIEPGTGQVRAYVGGPDYRYFKYDNVRQGKRQVGSTIKPYIYTLAMESGMNPCTQIDTRDVKIAIGRGRFWAPKDGHAGGLMDLRHGLTISSNTASAYLMREFGPNAMIRTMRKMGISTYVEPVPALCVGSADLSVFEMVAAYNTFPGYGVYATPMFVTKIEDREGNVIAEFTEHRRVAIQAKAAYQMISMMRSVVDGGTGGRLRYSFGLRGQIAGKTGTTNDNSDGWFIGYTPKITAGVWVGAEDRYVHFTSTALGQGANMALPIWGIWMKKVLADGTLGISAGDVFNTAVDITCSTPPRLREETKELEKEYF